MFHSVVLGSNPLPSQPVAAFATVETPRVLSVLSGGRESALREDGMGLETNWRILNVINQTTTMMTLVFYRFADQCPDLALVHA